MAKFVRLKAKTYNSLIDEASEDEKEKNKKKAS